MPLSRQLCVIVHRWAGLTIAFFMVVVGITGAIIPWQTELQSILAPQRFIAPASPNSHPMAPIALMRIAEARSGGVVDYLPLWREPNEPAVFSLSPRPGQPPLDFDEILLDPYSGREIARDRADYLSNGAQIIPFIYRLHISLALGAWGEWVLGLAAVIWTLDCFIGFYLSLPLGRRAWWRHFGKSWRVRWRASGFRLNFDLHRAGGLWLWPMLLVFAWSSVAMNMPQAFNPVMAMLTDFEEDRPLPSVSRPVTPGIDMAHALALLRRAAQREAAARGLHIERERVVRYNADTNSYSYAVRTERDRSEDGANSYFTIDGNTGRLLRVELPTGEHSGNTIGYWFGELHVAGVFGLPYRIFVSIFGVLLTVITVTGLVIWMRKRAARLLGRTRASRGNSGPFGYGVAAE